MPKRASSLPVAGARVVLHDGRPGTLLHLVGKLYVIRTADGVEHAVPRVAFRVLPGGAA